MHTTDVRSSCSTGPVATGPLPTAAGTTIICDQPQLLQPMKPDRAAHKLQMSKLDEQISLDQALMKKIKVLLHSKPIAGHVAAGRVGASATEQVLYSIPALKAERERLRQEIHDLRTQQHDIHSAYKKAWHVYGKEEKLWRSQQRRDRHRNGTTAHTPFPDGSTATIPASHTHTHSSSDRGRRRHRCRGPAPAIPPVRPERAAVRFGHRSHGRSCSSSRAPQAAQAAATVVATPAAAAAPAATAPELRSRIIDAVSSSSSSNSGEVLDRLDLSGVFGSAEPPPFRHYPAIPGWTANDTTGAPAVRDDDSDAISLSTASSSSSSSSDDSDTPLVSNRDVHALLDQQQQEVQVAEGQQPGLESTVHVNNPFVSLPSLTFVQSAEPAAPPPAAAAMQPVEANRDLARPLVAAPVLTQAAAATAPASQPAAAAAERNTGQGATAQGSFTVAITGGGTDPERLTCIICLDAPRSVLLLPCKHLVLCEGCARDLQETAARGADNAGRRSRRVRRGGGGRRRSRPVAGAEVPGTVVRVLWRVWFGRGRDNDNHSDTDSVFSGASATESSSRGRGAAGAGDSGCLPVSCPVCRVPVEQQMLVYT